MFPPAVIRRFEERSIPEPNSGCWLWLSHSVRYRYGGFHYNRRSFLAHRFSWLLYRGSIPDGLNVLHRCDNTWCVNPDHLFLGTQLDNMHDMIAKGRQPDAVAIAKKICGEQHYCAKLTEQQVRDIRTDDRMLTIIAAEYGINDRTVGDIKRRKTWKHVAQNPRDTLMECELRAEP